MTQLGAFTAPASTGNLSVTSLTALPTLIVFTVSQKTGTDNTGHFSHGAMDGAAQWVHSTYSDTTGSKSVKSTSKCISHYERVSGTITEVLAATFVSFDNNGGGVYGFTINFSATSSNYQVAFVAYG